MRGMGITAVVALCLPITAVSQAPVDTPAGTYLLNAQGQGGFWYMRSRAPKFQPYFQSGFPYEHDQWISSAAAGWAVMALAPATEKEKRVSR